MMDLLLPKEGTHRPNAWYISTSVGNYLLNDGKTIGDVGAGTNTDDFYFDGEWNAHKAAAGYYREQGKPYPHIRRWETLSKELHGAVKSIEVVLSIDPTVVESQVMEFE